MRDEDNWDWLINGLIIFLSICLALGLIWAYFALVKPLLEPKVIVSEISRTETKIVETQEKYYPRPPNLYAVTYPYLQDEFRYLKALSRARGFIRGATKNYPCRAYFQVICKDENNHEIFMSRFPAKPLNSDLYIDSWGRMRSTFSCDEFYYTQECVVEPCLKEEFYGGDGRYFFRVILEGPEGFETKGNWEYLGKTKK